LRHANGSESACHRCVANVCSSVERAGIPARMKFTQFEYQPISPAAAFVSLGKSAGYEPLK
jgi:hypothetical protein